MTHTEMTNGLEMRWIPVVDASGRTHMEARWIQVGQDAAPALTPAYAA